MHAHHITHTSYHAERARIEIDGAKCEHCGDKIDPRNYASSRYGFACLPCDDERIRETAHYMTTEY